MAQTKLSATQMNMLHTLAEYGPVGRGFVANVNTAKALIERGLVDHKRVNGSLHYTITDAGCAEIGETMADLEADYVERRSAEIMQRYVAYECIVLSEQELQDLGHVHNIDPESLRNAFIACGGDMVEQPAPIIEQPAIVEADVEATAEIETDGVLVGEPAMEIECATCGKLFMSLDSDHVECETCDEAAADYESDMRLNEALIGTEKPREVKMAYSFKVGDKVVQPSRPYLGVATIRSFWGCVADLSYENKVKEGVGIAYLTLWVDPRDAQIKHLMDEIAQLKDERDRLNEWVAQQKRARHSGVTDDIMTAVHHAQSVGKTPIGQGEQIQVSEDYVMALAGVMAEVLIAQNVDRERETEDRGEAGKGIFFG